jgi:hypothetical protein
MLLNQWNLEIFLDVAKAFQKYKSVSRPGQKLYDLVKIRRAKPVATVALTH